MAKKILKPVTIIYIKDKETGYYTSQVKEYPQAISQGKTKVEAASNLMEVLSLFSL